MGITDGAAADLFVFAGAGISIPSGLPSFKTLRDQALADLRMSPYLDAGPSRFVAEGIDPEAFFSALHRAEIDLTAWLRGQLDDAVPNEGHRCLALLGADGASVWTQNFDELIERAAGDRESFRVSSWPDAPSRSATLLKPHRDHPSAVPFSDLPAETQAEDAPFAVAIRTVAASPDPS